MNSITFDSDFPSGNGGRFTQVGPDHYSFEVDLHGGARGMWFHFAVGGAAGRPLTFDIRNADKLLGWPHLWRGVRVFQAGPQNDCWQRGADPGQVLVDQGLFRFRAAGGEPLRLALAPPYPLARLQQFRSHFLHWPQAREELVTLSQRGLPVYGWRLGNGPAGVWLLARTHASETPPSWVLEGLLAALVDHPRITVRVCPMVDVDNVQSGAYGKFGPPVDPAHDWNDHPALPQIAALQSWFAAAPERPAIFLDLHSPLPAHPTFACTWNEGAIASALLARLAQFTGQLQQQAQPPVTFDLAMTRGYPEWFGDKMMQSPQGWFLKQFACPTLTLEIAYQHEEADYRAFGADLARVVGAMGVGELAV